MDPRWRHLHDLAMRQQGQVATRQVEAAGLTRPALHYQVQAGLLEPVARGVYRFTTFPPSDREREAALLLWAGADQGVAAAFSHETALRRYELTDVFPEKLHLTVPRSFRKRALGDVVLHRAELAAEEVRRDDLLAYTTPARTFLDLLAVGFPVGPLREAYREAVDRGLVRRGTLEREEARGRVDRDGVPRDRAVDLHDRLVRLMDGA